MRDNEGENIHGHDQVAVRWAMDEAEAAVTEACPVQKKKKMEEKNSLAMLPSSIAWCLVRQCPVRS